MQAICSQKYFKFFFNFYLFLQVMQILKWAANDYWNSLWWCVQYVYQYVYFPVHCLFLSIFSVPHVIKCDQRFNLERNNNVWFSHKITQNERVMITWLQLNSNPEPLSSETNTQPFGQTGQMLELCSEYLSVRCIWLYILVMPRTLFRVNPHSIFAWMSRNSLFKAAAKSADEVTATALKGKTT